MTKAWSTGVADYLVAKTACPRCDATLNEDGTCPRCRADLRGPIALKIWDASLAAADAIRTRQSIIDRVPTLERETVPLQVAAVTPRQPIAVPAVVSESPVSVQSVLSVAGAALLAVAALVFTYFNPDLTDDTARTVIVAGVTVLFLGSAWLLSRAGLRFSAEAVGALGTVFLLLDVSVIATPVWTALATLVLGAALIGLAVLVRLRTWLWVGLVAIAASPLVFITENRWEWAAVVGALVAGLVIVGLRELVARLAPRFDGALRADIATVVVLQFAALGFAFVQVLALARGFDPNTVVGIAGVFAAIALIALLSARRELRGFWNFVTGGFAVAAIAVLPATFLTDEWMISVFPAAGTVALIAIAWVRPPITLLLGAWIAAGLLSLPAAMLGILQGVMNASDLPFPHAAIGVGVAAIGAFVIGRRSRELGLLASILSIWVGLYALTLLVFWNGLLPVTQVVLAIALALALAAIDWRVPSAPLWVRAPLVVGAHLVLILGAGLAWREQLLGVIGGVGVLLALALVAQRAPRVSRAVHLGVGYAYALVLLAASLDLARVDGFVVLCVVSSAASLIALAATLIPRASVRAWYAVLIVTGVPFIIGIASVLVDRRGWTGVSTFVTFALALTLVLTTRPGLTRTIRSAAAALLVPALAVVVICVGSYYVESSASPVTLPIIAVLVALVLPFTGRIETVLLARGLEDVAARDVRTWIEGSALLTAAIAVLLSLARSAAGLPTTITVLLIIAVGATAAGLYTKRLHAWIAAALGYTGALWAALALAQLQVIELYVLPPALAAALLGAVLSVRGTPTGRALYWSGLSLAAATSLAALAVSDDQGAGVPWRTLGLLAGSAVLLALSRIGELRLPSLAIAVAAAGAGAVQALRYGRELDSSGAAAHELILVALAFSAVAAILAAIAGRALASSTTTRWLFALPLVYLVAGPIAAVRVAWLPVWIMLALTVALLALMIATVAKRAEKLPPVWFTFTLAWAAAVAGWSTREYLRVEAFSLPLGIALLIAGAIALRNERPGVPSLGAWPSGFAGSWYLLGPGLLVTLGPSMLATATDPRTERAILVIGLALAAILVGSVLRLAAPFVLGLIVLPIENVIVFAVQIGRQIGATPWWITLATAGATLLVIAATSERRGQGGIAARMRDLA
jgi:hypothetical protein